MIVKMERLSVFGMIQDKERLINQLIRKRCVQFIEPKDALGELALSANIGKPEASKYQETLGRYEAALEAMRPYAAKTGLFSRRPRLD